MKLMTWMGHRFMLLMILDPLDTECAERELARGRQQMWTIFAGGQRGTAIVTFAQPKESYGASHTTNR